MIKQQLRSLTLVMALLLAVVTGWSPASYTQPVMPILEVGERPGVVLRMSKLIMGTDHLGKMPNEQTVEVLNEAVRLGINTFDTAPIYTDDIELRLGAWLKSQKRSDLYVITKGGFPRDLGPGTYESRLKGTSQQITDNVMEEVQGSRARFDRAIAIYLMHRDDGDFQHYERVERPQTPVKTILEALSAPQLTENFLMVGLSNWEAPRVDDAMQIARRHPQVVRPVASSPYFSLLEMGSETIHSGGVQVTHADMMSPDFQKGMKLMTYSPLGGFSIVRRGWEAARQDALERKLQNDRYWGHAYEAIFHEANARRFERALSLTDRLNAEHGTRYTVDQILNAYVLAHPRTDFMIIGPRTVEQLHRTVEALEVAKLLTLRDLDYLHAGDGIN